MAQTPMDVIPLILCHCLKVGEFITFGGLLNRKRCWTLNSFLHGLAQPFVVVFTPPKLKITLQRWLPSF